MNFAPQTFEYVSTIGGWLWHNPIREEGDDSVHVPPTITDRVFVVLWARMACYLIACILLVPLACKNSLQNYHHWQWHCHWHLHCQQCPRKGSLRCSGPGRHVIWLCASILPHWHAILISIIKWYCQWHCHCQWQWHCSGLRSKQGPVKVEGLPDHAWPVIVNAIEGVLFGSYYHSSCAVRYFKLVKVGSCHEDLAVAPLL